MVGGHMARWHMGQAFNIVGWIISGIATFFKDWYSIQVGAFWTITRWALYLLLANSWFIDC